MSTRRVTIEDVARRAGVSTATVSRTVNGTACVADGTLKRVREAIDELGFRPTPAAQNLRQRRTRNIALVTPTMLNPFFPELVAGVHPELQARGYSLLVIDTEEPEREAVRAADSRIVDGVLLVASSGEAKQPLQMPWDVPMVAIDRTPSMLEIDVVQCDNEAGARDVMRHLIGCGHTRIAHIRGPARLDVATQRARGYLDGLAFHGVPFDDRLVITGNFDEDSGFAAASALLTAPRPPTAIFAANDLMAIGAIAAAHQHGLRVPDDVAVAGFDGIHLGRYTQPALTTFVQPFAALAQKAAKLLVDAIDRRDSQAFRRPATTLTQLPGRLIVRGSTVISVPPARGQHPGHGSPTRQSDPTPAGAL